MDKELVLVADFGGQYSQLIARRVRECGVYCEVYPHTLSVDGIKEMNPKGVIFTGGPNSVYGKDPPLHDKTLSEIRMPMLGVCCGSQLMARILGGKVATAPVNEHGKTKVDINVDSKISDGVSISTICWMSHTDYMERAPEGFKTVANTSICSIAVIEYPEKKLYAVQPHPEAIYTREGTKMILNFLYNVYKYSGDWKIDSPVEKTIQEACEEVRNGKVLCALSGGVDSSVAVVLLLKTTGSQLTCVFVDYDLLRENEEDEAEEVFGPSEQYGLNFIRVNAQERFCEELKGTGELEQKRKIIGEELIRVFEEEAKKTGTIDFLVQGTIYPDVVEGGLGRSAAVKSRHNVGGPPDYVDFKEIIEPLRLLFKDEVRRVGLEFGIPEKLVYRQPFPGSGLGIRIISEITVEKVRMVQNADAIYREEAANTGVDRELGQYSAAFTNMHSVGIMGDERTHDYAVVLRAVATSGFMIAESADLPWEILRKVATRIVNEVKGTNRVMYDCAGKPSATIEFE